MKIKSERIPKELKPETVKLHKYLFDKDIFIYFLLGITILYILIVRIHLLSFPLERDEGEYAYMGKLILDGHPPYTLAYNMKLPGTAYMYAIMMGIFGKSVVGIHLGLTFIALGSFFLVFLISTNFVSKIGSVISSAAFGIMGTSSHLFGQAAHATHFVVFFALIGIYVLLQLYKSEKNKLLKYFIPGFFFSLAFICKQSGLFFVLFGATVIIVEEARVKPLFKLLKNLLLFSLGFVVPLIILLLYIRIFGDFEKFWFWTVKYLSKYSVQVPFSRAFEMFINGVGSVTSGYSFAGNIVLWILSLVGIPFIFINKGTRRKKIIILSFLFFSFLTIFPGLYFRCHYFITLLPAAGLMIAVFFDFVNDFLIPKLKSPNIVFISLFTFIILAGTGVYADRDYVFKVNPKIECKKMYGINPFVESLEIAKFLKQNTNKTDKIAVLGSEPQICFYADRYSATGYIYTYNLVELHSYALSMQKEMVKEIEISKPKYLLFVNVRISWLVSPNSETFLFKWMDKYVIENYALAGYMDIFPDKISSLKVLGQLNNLNPQSKEFISIYERK
jgi:hypothetical protein